MNRGTLYICPTPIGNLKDITLRTLEVLKNVDLILCEDTRTSAKLLSHYDITTKTQSYHKFNEKQSVQKIVDLLDKGQNIALISDAGTPLISDPGEELVSTITKEGLKVVPLPGASALTTFVSGISNPCGKFVFIGFLPKKKGEKQNIFKKFFDTTVIFYESPNRIIKTLEEIKEINPNAQVAIGRELTKVYEEINQGAVDDLIEYYTKKTPKGEIVAALIAQQDQNKVDSKIADSIIKLQKNGYNINEISKILSAISNFSKKEIYKMGLNLIKK